MASAARSGGVSRSNCRFVMKITTPYELRALIWDYFFKFFRCVCVGGGTAQVPKSFIQSVSVSSFLTTLRSTCFWTTLVSNAALTCFSPCSDSSWTTLVSNAARVGLFFFSNTQIKKTSSSYSLKLKILKNSLVKIINIAGNSQKIAFYC